MKLFEGRTGIAWHGGRAATAQSRWHHENGLVESPTCAEDEVRAEPWPAGLWAGEKWHSSHSQPALQFQE